MKNPEKRRHVFTSEIDPDVVRHYREVLERLERRIDGVQGMVDDRTYQIIKSLARIEAMLEKALKENAE